MSFLSRFIGNKKKDAAFQIADDDASSVFRPEGMDAELFSQPIDNFGYSPRHPQPPRYIKIRAKFKKEKEFDRVFLAQELRTQSLAQDGQRPTTSGGQGASPTAPRQATDNPVWALEFSKDGKYLAAGGQDKVVRVWAVIANPEERVAHEQAEEVGGGSIDGSGLHLNAPVFQKKTFREYKSHESTILDLSWSKVGDGIPLQIHETLTCLEQLPPLIVHGQDGSSLAYKPARLSMHFQACGFCPLNPVSPQRRPVLPRRLPRYETQIMEYTGQERGVLESIA